MIPLLHLPTRSHSSLCIFQVQLRVDKLIGRIPAYEDPELAPGGIVRPSALYLAAVLCDVHGPLGIAAHTHYSEAEEGGCQWESLLSFAPKYRDLGPTAQIALTVWEVREGSPGPVPLGGTTLRLFSKKGRLKAGSHALKLWLGKTGDISCPSSTPGKSPVAGRGRAGHIERALKKFQRGEFEAVPWLDALAVKAAQDALASETEASRKNGAAIEDLQIVVEIPPFQLPVLFQDAVLSAAGSTPAAAAVIESTGDALSTPLPGTSGSGVAAATPGPTSPGSAALGVLGRSLATGTGRIIIIHDPEVGKESPAEVKAQKLARSTGRGLVDAGLRPNTAERLRIDAVLAQPPGRPLPREDRELLWRFRFALVGEGRALTRFLKCVDWGDAAEAAQAEELMCRWARISVADALELLSPDYTVEAVRAHAVAALRPTSDEELLHFLLQLVQALRYEPVAESRLAAFLVDRARRSAAVASALFWYLCAELDDPTFGDRAAQIQSMLLARQRPLKEIPAAMPAVPQDCIPLQLKLVARLRHLADAVRAVRSADRKTEVLRGLLAPGGACADLTTFECPCPLDPGVRLLGIVSSGCSVFRSKVSPIRITFRVELPGASWIDESNDDDREGVGTAGEVAEGQAGPGDGTGEASARLASLSLGRDEEEEVVATPREVADTEEERAVRNSTNFGAGDAAEGSGGPNSSPKSERRSSAPQTPQAGAGTPPASGSASGSPGRDHPARATTTLSLIYKRGDDLRQDQLVLQLISLMDRLLKREHLDLRITAYQVLPTSAIDGLIEFVPASLPLSQVFKEHGSIHRFLARRHPDPKGPYGLDPGVLANYVRSCAGYVVVTHILGIGDRHMDNLMLTTDGRLFHIDFGYVLGRDPKFNTAPLVLSRAMVDGMGGADGPHYRQFVQLCGEAFNILRKSANLLLSLVHLMAGSSIPDVRSDPEKALLKVQERLLLGTDDESAAEAMEQMLVAAQAAVLPRFAEVQHRVAQGWR